MAAKHDNPERGAVAPMTAMLMVALLGMTAFAVDVAMMYSEHAQLQNGADSSAIGIAQACAKNQALPTVPHPLSSHHLGRVERPRRCHQRTSGHGEFRHRNRRRDHTIPQHLRGQPLQLGVRSGTGCSDGGYQGLRPGQVRWIFSLRCNSSDFSQCEADPGFTKGLQFFPVHGTKLSDDPDYACTHQSSSGFEFRAGSDG